MPKAIETIRAKRPVKLLYADGTVGNVNFYAVPPFVESPEAGGKSKVFSLLCESQTGASFYVELLGQ